MSWDCAICDARVEGYQHTDQNGVAYGPVMPVSHYWYGNIEVVLCSPECSLKHYQAIHKKVDNE